MTIVDGCGNSPWRHAITDPGQAERQRLQLVFIGTGQREIERVADHRQQQDRVEHHRRIGLAAARGLALAGDLPCLGITTFEAVAAGVPETEWDGATLLVAIESKREDIYVQLFAAGLEPLSAPQAVLPEALATAMDCPSITEERVLVVGDAGQRSIASLKGAGLEVALSNALGTPDAGTLAALAARRWSPNSPNERPRPLYLKAPDAKMPKDGGRLRP